MSLSDALDRSFTVTEMAPLDELIEVSPETTAAFVGRALRGPLNQPVRVESFGEFRRRFGDVWTRSSLGPAVRHFFDHGGRSLYVVRVANDARGAMICLPASGSALVLRALEPGTTERLRAAVDFDRVDPADDEHFNLTVQRIDPETGLVCDQEIFPGVSYREDDEDFVAERLLASTLVRVESPYPRHRPEASSELGSRAAAGYVEQVQHGSDGHELSDYDLVGSRTRETGLFALQQVERFDLLYLPPPGKGRDLGPASLLAAELYCRARGAMLIVDPAATWVTPAKAVEGVRQLGMASPNALTYFPRMYLRRDDDGAPRAVGGAIAGLLCRHDRTDGAWRSLDASRLGLSREFVPAFPATEDDLGALHREGLNVLVEGSGGRSLLVGNVTLGRGTEEHRRFATLSVRRLTLQLVNAVAAGTRWAVFEPVDARLAERIKAQVNAYLAALANLGAFEADRFAVACDAGVSQRDDRVGRGVTIMISACPAGCAEPVSFTLHQAVAGCRVASSAFVPAFDSDD
jgi:hypothetical protein